MIFLQKTRESHRQSDEHLDRFKGNVGETSEKRGGALMGFSERINTILNLSELVAKDEPWQLQSVSVFSVSLVTS